MKRLALCLIITFSGLSAYANELSDSANLRLGNPISLDEGIQVNQCGGNRTRVIDRSLFELREIPHPDFKSEGYVTKLSSNDGHYVEIFRDHACKVSIIYYADIDSATPVGIVLYDYCDNELVGVIDYNSDAIGLSQGIFTRISPSNNDSLIFENLGAYSDTLEFACRDKDLDIIKATQFHSIFSGISSFRK